MGINYYKSQRIFGHSSVSCQILGLSLILSVACAQEKNPYKNRYEGPIQAEQTEFRSGDAEAQKIEPLIDPVTGEISPNDVQPVDNMTPVVPGVPDPIPVLVDKPELDGVPLICANASAFVSVQAEFDALCKDGKATDTFAKAYAAPYKGGADVPLVVIKSTDLNSVSEFMFLAVIEVAKPIADVMKLKKDFNSGTIVAGNSTVVQTVLASTPPVNQTQLESLDIKFAVTLTVGILKFNSVSVQKSDSFVLNSKKSVEASIGRLKVGAPENSKAILANTLSFMIQEGDKTRIVSVNHQKINNQGQGATAAKSAVDIGKAMMKDAYMKGSR